MALGPLSNVVKSVVRRWCGADYSADHGGSRRWASCGAQTPSLLRKIHPFVRRDWWIGLL